MFLKVHTQMKNGKVEPRMIAMGDIAGMKPATNAPPAATCISSISQPEFPVWALESMEEIEAAIEANDHGAIVTVPCADNWG